MRELLVVASRDVILGDCWCMVDRQVGGKGGGWGG